MLRRIVLFTILVSSTLCQTPVIGGTCKLGTADVQIGGKQTQFFLKCETTADSAEGEGVWVVKSRAAAAAPATPVVVPAENTQPQQHPKARKPASPNICEQDNGARENEACAVSATCLQAHNEFPSSYLQCDQTNLRWVRKSCQEGFLFNFEQQTCIVPKRMSSLSQNCSKCPLGTACRGSKCVPLTTSNICSDGSPPNGTCGRSAKPCAIGHFCTAQQVCCPITALHNSLGCSLVCTIDEACPKGLACQNNCCEPRKLLRSPTSGYDENLEGVEDDITSNDLFVMPFDPLENSMDPLVEEPTTTMKPIEKCKESLSCWGTNANCTSDDECPSSFKCDKSCCRLAQCPKTQLPVKFTCSSQYHCRANERCIFGGCCPKTVDLAVIRKPTIISNQEKNLECDIDDRVEHCDIDIVCPEASECVDGKCCKLPPSAKCGNGLMALTIPSFCELGDDCPIASRCEYGKCCPLSSEVESEVETETEPESEADLNENNFVDIEEPSKEIVSTPILKSEITSTSTKIWKSKKGISTPKSNCLSSSKCDLHTLCPPKFTCSLTGKCCKLEEKCGDGTVPETSCDPKNPICPSSSHHCQLLSKDNYACCTSSSTSFSISNSDCPLGSSEVDPRFGTSCRYSLQCPSPYFCNSRGRCQQASGLVCTFSSCSNSNPCSVGTCNNGYCCSSNSNSAPAIIVSGGSSGCPGCQQAPQIITIPQNSCPGGGYSVGGCSSGYCATGYSCIQNQCCPSYSSAPRISVYTCSSGGSAVGACISGRCATGYACQNNVCCPSTTTTNPFICSDGTQAVGGCVNGQCGTGYTCSNGLCCTGSSTTVKCLDGSDAVGACIPSCQGDGCGGVTVSYYCGSGYTCTTGNICCAINSCPNGGEVLGPTINGLCPTGYTAQGGVCCSALCSDGTSGIAAVNGACITGYTYTNGVCCASTSTVTCSDEISIGPCIGSGYNGGCPVGYTCDSSAVNCCPVVDYSSEACQVGPAIDGLCPPGYVVVYIPNSPLISNGVNPGTCIDVQCTTGLCAAADQIGECDQSSDAGTCPTGYTCNTNAGICCSSTTFSRLRIGKARPMVQRPNYGRPLNSYMPPRQCADGSLPSGACMNGLCGIGLECQNGQCCQPGQSKNKLQSKCPSGDTAVSGCFPNGSCGTGYECVSSLNLCCPPGQPTINNFNNNNNNFGGFGSVPNSNSIRPIGSRCQFDGECVGNGEGLSMCHAGVCQCSPIAYSQGIACIRRHAFQMNDEPINDAADEKSSNTISV
ncbi:unnamed protein product [Caenorhabditis angaria]|uniref:Chitin-binding type-2 domain-containing protein n=1 Tax=Caenorhabditis angaria TaxID=860376 RepID=A0A9P1IHN8_9PELO|nr:unnamed protein product [Caenorhabditis angaria]